MKKMTKLAKQVEKLEKAQDQAFLNHQKGLYREITEELKALRGALQEEEMKALFGF